MSGRRAVRRHDERLGAWKLQDDLAALVRHLQGRCEQVELVALVAQDLLDHRSGHLPRLIGPRNSTPSVSGIRSSPMRVLKK
jgi:hypothetical protein